MAESFPDIAALRAQAQTLRAQADEIDKRLDEFLDWSRTLPFGLIRPTVAIKPIPPSLIGASDLVKEPAGPGQKLARRGKPPGALSMAWRRHYAVARIFDGDVFPLKTIVDQVNQEDGRESRPTAIRRHLKGHVEHGLLEPVGPDQYRMTQKLLEMLKKLQANDADTGDHAETSSPKGETGGATPPASYSDVQG